MQTLNHPIALRMKADSLNPQNPEDGTNFWPNGGCKLGTLIQGQESWDSEPRNPRGYESSSANFRGNGGERKSLRPSGGSVDHRQEIVEALTGGQWPHKIQMHEEKSSSRNRNPRNGGFHVGLDLTLLTSDTGPIFFLVLYSSLFYIFSCFFYTLPCSIFFLVIDSSFFYILSCSRFFLFLYSFLFYILYSSLFYILPCSIFFLVIYSSFFYILPCSILFLVLYSPLFYILLCSISILVLYSSLFCIIPCSIFFLVLY